MMTRCKKLITVFLILALMLSLTACGAFETKMAKAAKAMQGLESLRADFDVDLCMSMSMFGESTDLDLDMTGTAEATRNPLRGMLDMNLNMMGEDMAMLLFTEKKDGKIVLYASADQGQTWNKSDFEPGPMPKVDKKLGAKDLAALAKIAATFQQTGTETIKGSEAEIYAGSIRWEDLKEYVDLNAMLKAMNESAKTNITLEDLNLDQFEDLPVSIGIDKQSGMIVKVSLDMTSVMKVVMPLVMKIAMESAVGEQALGGMDFSALGIQLDAKELIVTAILYDYNAVGEITIPNAAKKAA